MLTYKLIPTADLIPYARNSRTHSEAQVTKIASSIKEFGFINPVVTDGKNGIVAGHGRVLAASKLGLKEVPCVEASHLTEAQKRAYVIADNRMALDAGWDIDLLKVELGDLQGMDFDLSLTGFDPGELENFLAEKTEGLTDPDAVPETPANPVTVAGDVWIMGKHRLRCGDSTSIDAVDTLMAGGKADMVFTDPPYNIASDSENYAAHVSKAMNDLKNSEWDKGFEVTDSVASIMHASAENVTIYIWTSHFLIAGLWDALKDWTDFTGFLVWSKPNPMPSLSKRHPTWSAELCAYATRGTKRTVNFPTSGHFLSVREVVKKSDGSHPTQKPIELIEPIIEFSSRKGQVVLDLFGGSGSTLIACEKTARESRLMELDPKYCDVIVKRWQDFTGNKATLESTGQTFEDVASNRYDWKKDSAASYDVAIAAKRKELEATP
jgi:DNA modification methylase